MGYFTVPTGSQLPLNLQLFDGDPSKYPLAYLYNAATNVAVPGSPFPLAHFANGLYLNDVPGLPDGRYFATYIVFSDSGHTTESTTHTREEDYFQIDPTVAQIQDIDTLVQRLPIIETKIDNINVNTSASSIASAVWDANKSAHDTPQTFGYTNSGDLTGPRAILLDNLQYLDISVSSRASQASMLAGFNLGAKDIDTAKQAQLLQVITKLGTPFSGTIAGDLADIDNEVDNIQQIVGTTGVVVNSSSILDIADQVWDTTLALHVAPGTTGEKLSMSASGGIVTPADIANIANAVWDEPMGAHLIANSAGAYENLIPLIKTVIDTLASNYTPGRAAKLDYLDAAISSRESEASANTRSITELAAIAAVQATANAIDTLVTTINLKLGTPFSGTISGDLADIDNEVDLIKGKTDNLPADPASQSATNAALAPIITSVVNTLALANAIKLKTDNLPVDPASESTVLTIPTNPLLDNDPRLNYLDAPISSRVKPSQLAPLATTAGLTALQNAIHTDILNVLAQIAPLATTSQLNAAVAPLAQQILLQAVKTAVDNLALNSLTAAQVWANPTRTLTDPVDVNLDISGLATAAQLAATQTAILSALPKTECQAVVSIDPDTDTLTAEAWMIQDGTPLTDRDTCTVNLYDSAGALACSIGPELVSSPQGVFTLTRNSASAVLIKNRAYVAEIIITKGVDSKTSLKSITVF